jgi:hypothetical protein
LPGQIEDALRIGTTSAVGGDLPQNSAHAIRRRRLSRKSPAQVGELDLVPPGCTDCEVPDPMHNVVTNRWLDGELSEKK